MIIQSFNINTSDIATRGAFRNFIIDGDVGASFRLFATYDLSSVLYYYNFDSAEWQTTPYYLDGSIPTSTGYEGYFNFPPQTAARQIDIFLLADQNSGTTHAPYNEVLDVNGEIDINASSGSNSLMLTKKINQVDDGSLTIKAKNPTGTGLAGGTRSEQVITVPVGSTTGVIPFSISFTTANGSSLTLDRQPFESDFIVSENRNILDPIKIQGEDLFGAGQTARSTNETVAVGGGVTNGTTITMTNAIGSPAKWAVGDRVSGTDQLDALTSDNAVTIVSISGGSSKILELSQNVTISDGETLDFTEPYYYRWEINSIDNLLEGMFLGQSANSVDGSIIAPYKTEYVNIDALVASSNTVVTVTGEKRITTTTVGEVVFNKPQPYSLANSSLKILAKGSDFINTLIPWNIQISDLAATITKPTTTTTAAVINDTDVPIANARGIMDGNVSTVSSINIDSSTSDPTVTSIGSYNEASNTTATLTLSAAQTLENGETLTFDRAGQILTITGKIKIYDSAGDLELNVDLEEFVTGTVETA
tara:strand:- start:85 stop:1689 length:1605 start_codon:yes stop_codon:yes gene_type:complete